jgi:hypothetical protein
MIDTPLDRLICWFFRLASFAWTGYIGTAVYNGLVRGKSIGYTLVGLTFFFLFAAVSGEVWAKTVKR